MSKLFDLSRNMQNLLPASDKNSECVEGEDGRTLVAGTYALFSVKDDQLGPSGMWHEIQYAKWDSESKELTVVWIDPEMTPLRLTTVEENPDKFMKILTSRVNDTIVITRQKVTDIGTVVSSSIRRNVDGTLFSTTFAQGRLRQEDQKILSKLEQSVRHEVGLVD